MTAAVPCQALPAAAASAGRVRRRRSASGQRRSVADRDRKRARACRPSVPTERTDLPAAPEPAVDLLQYCRRLTVTQGEHEGERLTVLPWQRDYLRAVEGAAGGELGLSVAAGAGKTTLLASIAAAGVAGPLAQPRAAVVLVAASFATSLHGVRFTRMRSCRRRSRPTRTGGARSDRSLAALIEDRATGAQLRAREAAPNTLHGSAPALVVADEPAQWRATQRDAIYSALRSRLGKVPGARLAGHRDAAG